MVYQPSNSKWKCEKCGKEIDIHQIDNFYQLPPECPECKIKMSELVIIHRGPFPDNPFKKY